MSVDGTPKFTSLSVKEVTVSFSTTNVALTGKAAFVDRNTNMTHGWTNGEGAIWSRETIEAVLLLQQSMENDLARLHFVEGGGGRASVSGKPLQIPTGGLGEHLEEADQV